jgi:hypothetical protein
MIANVQDDMNDSSAKFVSADAIVRYFNRAQAIIARRIKYWKKEGTIDVVAATETYDLTTKFTDFVDLHSVRWYEETIPMESCNTKAEYDEIKNIDSYFATTGPSIYTVQSNQLFVYPAPSATADDALVCWYSYIPPSIVSGATGPPIVVATEPSVPSAYDAVLEGYALVKINKRRFADRGAMQDVQYWMQMFQDDLLDLAEQAKNAEPCLTPEW